MTPELFFDGRIELWCGDCLDVMDSFSPDIFDSACCDPPYHLQSIVDRFGGGQAVAKDYSGERSDATGAFARASAGFMNKKWDGGTIAFEVETWRRVYRVLKPGAYLIAFSSSRTYSRMAAAIEEAGFVTHPLIGYLFDHTPDIRTFIESLSSEQADAFGRIVDRADFSGMLGWIFGQGMPKAHRVRFTGLSDVDRQTDGWAGWRYGGQALKPALEPIYMGQKPFSEANGSANIQRWGVGALNIDDCRVGDFNHDAFFNELREIAIGREDASDLAPRDGSPKGRWPANVMTDGSDVVLKSFPDSDGQLADISITAPSAKTGHVYGRMNRHADKSSSTDLARRGDHGSAGRFFWAPKADADDRLGSKHPTVKRVDLIQELVRMITPPGGRCLDMFAGTGTLGEAAFRENMQAVLIEQDEEYQEDIRRRMRLCMAGPDERRRESIKAKYEDQPFEEGSLFGASNAVAPPGGIDRKVYNHFPDDGRQAERDRRSRMRREQGR